MRLSHAFVAAAVLLAGASAPQGASSALVASRSGVVPGKLIKFLAPNADEVAELVAKEAGGTAASRMAKYFAETKAFLDDAIMRASELTPGTSAHATLLAAGGAEASERLFKAMAHEIAMGARVHHSINEVTVGITMLTKQIRAAKALNGGRIPSGMTAPKGALELIEAVRTRAAKMGSDARVVDAKGFYVSFREATEYRELVRHLKWASERPRDFSDQELRLLREAFADVYTNGKEAATMSHHLVLVARKGGDDPKWISLYSKSSGRGSEDAAWAQAFRGRNLEPLPPNKFGDDLFKAGDDAAAGKADNAAAKGAADEDPAALKPNDEVTPKPQPDDMTKAADPEAAKNAAAEAAERRVKEEADYLASLGPAAVKAAKELARARRRTVKLTAFISRADAKRSYYNFQPGDADVLKDWDTALRRVSAQYVRRAETDLVRQSPFSHELLQQLQRQHEDLAELAKLNADKLPPGVRPMTEMEQSTLQTLREFFDGTPKPMRDFDGYYYSAQQLRMYHTIMEGGASTVNKGPAGVAEFAFRSVQYADTELERAIRAKLAPHMDEIAARADQESTSSSWDKLAGMLKLKPQKRPDFLAHTEGGSMAINFRTRSGGMWSSASDQDTARRLYDKLRSGKDFEFNRQELDAVKRAMDRVSVSADDLHHHYYGGYNNDDLPQMGDHALVHAAFENNVFLWKLFGEQWTKPTGAAAEHVSNSILRKKWVDL